jgi:hypothetical protein
MKSEKGRKPRRNTEFHGGRERNQNSVLSVYSVVKFFSSLLFGNAKEVVKI